MITGGQAGTRGLSESLPPGDQLTVPTCALDLWTALPCPLPRGTGCWLSLQGVQDLDLSCGFVSSQTTCVADRVGWGWNAAEMPAAGGLAPSERCPCGGSPSIPGDVQT